MLLLLGRYKVDLTTSFLQFPNTLLKHDKNGRVNINYRFHKIECLNETAKLP
jgi:hypothetical protein